MPRQVRIQYAGAFYHLMCRGDGGQAVFLSDSDRELFLRTLAEMCERSGMLIHSYVLMPNHYHLLAETPEPNLVVAMKWFQGTYTQRFNARHGFSGHLFQGRYKAIPVEADQSGYFGMVGDYIHLNPVRARMLGSHCRELVDYRWSSCGRFVKEAHLPGWLRRGRAFGALELPDEGAGSRRRYGAWMAARTRDVLEDRPGEEEARQLQEMRRGWCVGSESFQDRLMDWARGAVAGRTRHSCEGGAIRTHDEAEAERLLEMALELLGCGEVELQAMRQNDPRKQAVAWLIRSRTVMEDEWLVRRLAMGHRSNVSRALAAYRDASDTQRLKIRKLLHACAD